MAVFAIALGWRYVLAWTGPTQSPANGNIEAPITSLGVEQVKSGDLAVTDFVADSVTVGAVNNVGAVTSPKFCIGTKCITSWW